MWPDVTALPSALLQAELQAQLKVITRECPGLPGKETLAGWLQEKVVAACVLEGAWPGWRLVSLVAPKSRGSAFRSPGRHELRPWGANALIFLSSVSSIPCDLLSTVTQCWSPLPCPSSQSCPPLLPGHSCCSSTPHASFNNLFSGPHHVLLLGPFILCFPDLFPNRFSCGVLPGPSDHLLLFALPSKSGTLNFAACYPSRLCCLGPCAFPACLVFASIRALRGTSALTSSVLTLT